MKTNRRFVLFLFAGVVICIALLAYLVLPGYTAEAKSKGLIGSWDVVITVVNQNATFPGFLTFNSDGNLLADELPSLYETSGHGDWVATGTNQAAFTFHFLIGSSTPQYIKGTVSGTASYNPDTDQWAGPFTIQLVDQDGNEVLSDTGTMSGTRISSKP